MKRKVKSQRAKAQARHERAQTREVRSLLRDYSLIDVLSRLQRERVEFMRNPAASETARVVFHRRVLGVAAKAISAAKSRRSLRGCGSRDEE